MANGKGLGSCWCCTDFLDRNAEWCLGGLVVVLVL